MCTLQGIEYLIEHDLLKNTAEDVAQFLFKGEGLNKTAIGDYLGERYRQLCLLCRHLCFLYIFFRFDCSAHLHSIICCLLLQMYRGLSVCVCLLVTRVTLAKCLNHLRCHLGCLLVEAQATFIRWGPRFPTGKGTFGALYLGMPRLLCGQNSEPHVPGGSSDVASGYQYCSSLFYWAAGSSSSSSSSNCSSNNNNSQTWNWVNGSFGSSFTSG